MIYKGRIVWNARFNVLAEYNRDRQRGYVFTPETVERMAKLQEEYNRGLIEDKNMNTETEDRRSTQTPVISEQRTGNREQCRYEVNQMRCLRNDGHGGDCFSNDLKCMSPDSEVIRTDEFDQTRQHVHIPASLCPVPDCKEWPTVAGSEQRTVNSEHCQTPPRHVSPAIHEYRIFELETKLKAKAYLLDIERAKNAVLLQRIAGFERMNERLSNAVDEWLANATAEHKAAA